MLKKSSTPVLAIFLKMDTFSVEKKTGFSQVPKRTSYIGYHDTMLVTGLRGGGGQLLFSRKRQAQMLLLGLVQDRKRYLFGGVGVGFKNVDLTILRFLNLRGGGGVL